MDSRLYQESLKKIIMAIMLLSGTLASYAQSTEQWRDSLDNLSKAVGVNPSSTDLRLKKAAVELQLERWDYALDDYSDILKKDPKNPAALFYRAFTNEKLKRYKFARSDYEDFLRIVPMNFEARLGLALVNQSDKHYTEAIDQINQLVDQYPDSAVAYAARAGIEKERGLFDASAYDWTEAIKLSPKNADYYISRAEVYLADKKKEKALLDLEQAVKMGISRYSIMDMLKQCK